MRTGSVTNPILRDERGISLIETLVAMFVLTVGILALISSFDSAQKLTLTAERRASLTHRAEREIERLEAAPYEELAMGSIPAHSTETTNPNYYVNYGKVALGKESTCNKEEVENAGCYAWNSEKLTEEEPISVATKGLCSEKDETGCGLIAPGPATGAPTEACSETASEPSNEETKVGACKWTDGRLTGDLYAFVTWHKDIKCTGTTCATENAYKRITVVMTVNVPASTHAVPPVKVSTLIPDPNVAGKNPVTSPGTTCGTKLCTNGIAGNAQSWYLHDSQTEEDEKKGEIVEPSASHTTHATVATSNATACTASTHSGCPKPDLMDSLSPTATYLYDYSTDQDGAATITPSAGASCPGETRSGLCYGGRKLAKNVECSSGEPKPTAENLSNEMWVTTPLTTATKLIGAGGLSLYTQTVGGTVAASETLCIAIYDVEENIENLVEHAPKLIAYSHYTSTEWPTSLQPVSFDFSLTSATLESEPMIAEKHRLGFRVWVSASSSPITLVYGTGGRTETVEGVETDVDRYPAVLQLNTE